MLKRLYPLTKPLILSYEKNLHFQVRKRREMASCSGVISIATDGCGKGPMEQPVCMLRNSTLISGTIARAAAKIWDTGHSLGPPRANMEPKIPTRASVWPFGCQKMDVSTSLASDLSVIVDKSTISVKTKSCFESMAVQMKTRASSRYNGTSAMVRKK